MLTKLEESCEYQDAVAPDGVLLQHHHLPILTEISWQKLTSYKVGFNQNYHTFT